MEETKLPTAEEFFLKMYLPNASDEDRKLWLACNELAKDSIQIMIEFAKLHVMAALKEASEKAICIEYMEGEYDVKTDSILNSYPLSNIK